LKHLFVILFFLSSFCFSQKDTSTIVYTVVDEMPEFPGGAKEMMIFIQKNTVYPRQALEKNQKGKVYVKFMVNTKGKIKNLQVLKSSGVTVLDDEALRVISVMPDWKPGYLQGQAVNVWFNLPINFNTYNTKTQDELYNAGVNAFAKGDYKTALENYTKALEMNPSDIDALYNAGVAAVKLNENEKACEFWNKIKSTGKPDADQLIKQYCKN
jgi:TonB family protein